MAGICSSWPTLDALRGGAEHGRGVVLELRTFLAVRELRRRCRRHQPTRREKVPPPLAGADRQCERAPPASHTF